VKLATLDDGTPDGALVVTDGERFLRATGIAATMREALDGWDEVQPALRSLVPRLVHGEPLLAVRCLAPLPRTFEWLDGSAYISHVALVRRARGAELPARLREEPLMYQGSGTFFGPRAPIRVFAPECGADFEAELGVILRGTELGTSAEDALDRIALVVLLDDVTLRGLVPAELEKGFGFVQSKPPTAFAPLAVTPDELGAAFRGGRLHARLVVTRSGERFGELPTGPEMHFSFGDLVAHAARTRPLAAGTVIGSGTISSEDARFGQACIVERRMRETIEEGAPLTPYLREGEVVTIEAFDANGASLFGAIVQEVIA